MSFDARTLKVKKSATLHSPPPSNPSPSQPTTFFLKRERELDQTPQGSEHGSIMADSSFGVQSLEEMIAEGSNAESADALSRTSSINTDSSVEAGMDASLLAGRKRKAGNPVHPKIRTAGQRILSHDTPSLQQSATGSPVSLRSHDLGFQASSSSQPLTPLRLSPQPDSALPSTPRSASVRSLRLSDEEASVTSDPNSHAVQSSSSEEYEPPPQQQSGGSMPQLVMPSLAMPARKPYTERGRRMGRLKVMVVGQKGVGKTSLLRSIFRSNEDIVHVDSATQDSTSLLTLPVRDTVEHATRAITEVYASTKPYPPWWMQIDSSRSWRSSSSGDNVLDRNLCFIDTPAADDSQTCEDIQSYVETLLRRNATMHDMTESEVLHLMTGEGGVLVDVVLFLYDGRDPAPFSNPDSPTAALLQELHKLTNVIPVITHADTTSPEHIDSIRATVRSTWNDKYGTSLRDDEPFATSSALSEDLETMDASALMASGYIHPLEPSQLPQLLERVFSDEHITILRHMSTRSFLAWRRDNLGNRVDLAKQARLLSPTISGSALDILPSDLPTVTSSGSLPHEASKVLLPHSSSSYYRSASPSAATDESGLSGDMAGASAYALARRNESPSGVEPFRRVRLAKWAQDLQRSLGNERRRFREMYSQRPAEWDTEEAPLEKEDLSLVKRGESFSKPRPAKGRLGGDLGIIDPRDPLGVLAFGQAFSRQGWLVLRVAGGCGLIGATAWWVWNSWYEIQDFLGLGGSNGQVMHAPAIAAPAPQAASKGVLEWLDEVDWKRLLSW
ncbi:hypothetical protein K431DRAFT_284501 [Polychaeton citri CBS 116435]|uniref:Septin-type G domain-containing protein n=1 Tax=Polychaeton citri CBS 116435 TaxID=1314669 RepID=A0A9P4Q727_9PEZI|nr:hypothetical protein K431DRAFT_284501 [Polychaeton citri CBS 116435]